ncbi:MAG: phage portal protein [Rhodospirillaceae bacterium]
MTHTPAPMLVDVGGRPLRAAAMSPAYQASDRSHPAIADYHPANGSADALLLPERDALVQASRDVARNDPWITGGIDRHVDAVLGTATRPVPEPDPAALGITDDEAQHLADEIERAWNEWALDPLRRSDATRQDTVPALLAIAYRSWLVCGEGMIAVLWRPERGGWGSCLQVVDPARLSNRWGDYNTQFLRDGVALGADGEPIGYWLRRAHPADPWLMSPGAQVWDYFPREHPDGRPIIIHYYRKDEPGQTRGKPPLAPVIKFLRMLGTYADTELQAAVINSIILAYIESESDPEVLRQKMFDGQAAKADSYRASFYESQPIRLNRARVPMLALGDKINVPDAKRPNANFEKFEQAILRRIASPLGLSFEQLSLDYSRTNYSSARAALMEVWRSLLSRRAEFLDKVGVPVYQAFLEEALDRGAVTPPPHCRSLTEALAGWCACEWRGPARGYIDPVKEPRGAVLRLQTGTTTMERECGEQGLDWRRVTRRRQCRVEKDRRRRAAAGARSHRGHPWRAGSVRAPASSPAIGRQRRHGGSPGDRPAGDLAQGRRADRETAAQRAHASGPAGQSRTGRRWRRSDTRHARQSPDAPGLPKHPGGQARAVSCSGQRVRRPHDQHSA